MFYQLTYCDAVVTAESKLSTGELLSACRLQCVKYMQHIMFNVIPADCRIRINSDHRIYAQ